MKTLCLVRNYHSADVEKLAEIFKKSILAINDNFYNPEQKSAWIGNRSLEFWQNRFANTLPKIAVYQGKIVGFAEFLIMDNQGEIDCFYIDPNYHGLGVGKALLNHLLILATDHNLDLISVNASHNAKPFFKKFDFKTVQKNVVKKENIELENWLMILNL